MLVCHFHRLTKISGGKENRQCVSNGGDTWSGLQGGRWPQDHETKYTQRERETQLIRMVRWNQKLIMRRWKGGREAEKNNLLERSLQASGVRLTGYSLPLSTNVGFVLRNSSHVRTVDMDKRGLSSNQRINALSSSSDQASLLHAGRRFSTCDLKTFSTKNQ